MNIRYPIYEGVYRILTYEKGKTVYVFRKTQLIKVIKPKKLES